MHNHAGTFKGSDSKKQSQKQKVVNHNNNSFKDFQDILHDLWIPRVRQHPEFFQDLKAEGRKPQPVLRGSK